MLRLSCLFCLLCSLLACDSHTEPEQPGKVAETAEISGALVLVSGITGRQGGAVARALLEQGFQVRGLSRKPGSERAMGMIALGASMVKGDFNDGSSLDAAMQDVQGAFLVTNYWEHGYEDEVEQGRNFVDAAKRANVKHLVFSSVANSDQSTGIPHFDSKFEIEEYIRSVDIPYTILRPVSFMENWEFSKDSIVAGKITSPFSTATRMQQISVRDIGRFVALAFAHPENWYGRTLDIAADEYSMKEVVNLFSSITGSPVEFVQVPWAEYQQLQGEEMAIMDKWIDAVGYSANINLVRSELPGMWTLEEYLYQAGW